MNGIEFGTSLADPYDAASLIEISKHAEELGFESLWFTENVYPGVTALETLIALGVIATNTERVRFGPGVLILPLRNPVALAHATVTLDRALWRAPRARGGGGRRVQVDLRRVWRTHE